MSKYSVLEDPSYELWCSVLGNLSEGNFEQTFECGRIAKMGLPHTRVVRLVAMNGSEPLGIVQGTYSEYFGFGTCMRVSHGPVVNAQGRERLQILKRLLMALEDYGVTNRIILAELWWPESWGMQEAFRDLKYVAVSNINRYVVNLDRSVDKLWRSFARNKRKNVKKAIKMGVEVEQSDRYDDLLAFYRMLKASAERHGFAIYPFSWFKAAWEIFKPGQFARMFLARWKGKEAAGVFTVVHGETVYALAAGSASDAWRARPNDLLHWKVMKWACEQHFSRYSMGFVSEPIPTKGLNSWGIWRWKKEWNGDLETIRIFDKYFLPRYKYLLNFKNLVESCYTFFKKITR